MLQFSTPNVRAVFVNPDGTLSMQGHMFLSAIVQMLGGPAVVPGGSPITDAQIEAQVDSASDLSALIPGLLNRMADAQISSATDDTYQPAYEQALRDMRVDIGMMLQDGQDAIAKAQRALQDAIIDQASMVDVIRSMASQDAGHVAITGGTVALDKGSVAAPSYRLSPDAATGFYWIAANEWGFAINGVKLMDWSDKLLALTGRINLDVANAGTAALPSFYLGADATTGFYRIGADNWGFSAAGSKMFDISSGSFSVTGSVKASQQLQSTVATGTAPMVIASTTKVVNLYVDRAALADTATTATTAGSATTATTATNAGHATTADTLTSPSSIPAAATDLPTVITLANALRTAALAKGL